MQTKRKIPWLLLYLILLFMLVSAYFIAGLYKIAGVTILNYGDKLLYIICHLFFLA